MPIKVMIAEDMEIIRNRLVEMIGQQPDMILTGVAVNGARLLELVAQHLPDVVLTDIRMPETDGTEVARHLQQHYPQVRVLVTSMFDDDCYVTELIAAGVKGYLLKEAPEAEILDAIRIVYAGGRRFSTPIAHKAIDLLKEKLQAPTRTAHQLFSKRELEVLELMTQDYSTKEIAYRLQISRRTVEKHRDNMFEKAGVHNTVGLVLYAVRNGIGGR